MRRSRTAARAEIKDTLVMKTSWNASTVGDGGLPARDRSMIGMPPRVDWAPTMTPRDGGLLRIESWVTCLSDVPKIWMRLEEGDVQGGLLRCQTGEIRVCEGDGRGVEGCSRYEHLDN